MALSLTKLDVAKRELHTAIMLWFHDGDPVSIHLLAFSAHEIIHSLFRGKGLRGLFFDSPIIKNEHRNRVGLKVKESAAFFKHAQHDADAVHEFRPEVNEPLIMFCLHGLERMEEALGEIGTSFRWWIAIHSPDLLREPIKDQIPVEELQKLRILNKKQFLESWRNLCAIRNSGIEVKIRPD